MSSLRRTCFLVLSLSAWCHAEFIDGVSGRYLPRLDSVVALQKSKGDRKVLAHAMQYMFPGHVTYDDSLYRPDGKARLTGGLFEEYPLHGFHAEADDLTLATAKKEIELALQAGIDGFIYFYTVHKTGVHPRLHNKLFTLFRAAEAVDAPFAITIALTPKFIGHERSVAEKVEVICRMLKTLMDEVGADHPNWLRAPDGALILYTHQAALIGKDVRYESDILCWHETIDAKIGEIADAYYSVLETLDLDAHLVFRAVEKNLFARQRERFGLDAADLDRNYEAYLRAVCRHFPFVKFFRSDLYPAASRERSAAVAIIRENGRGFVGSVMIDSYTTRKFDENGRQIKRLKQIEAPGFDPDSLHAKVGYTGNSHYFTRMWEWIIDNDCVAAEIITWNDYLEGHAFAPTLNHHFGQHAMLKHFKCRWKTGHAPSYGSADFPEEVVVFFKKYKHGIEPTLFRYPLRKKIDFVPDDFYAKMVAYSNRMDVVTFLGSPAAIDINGERFTAGKGMTVLRVEPVLGRQHIRVMRNGTAVIDYTTTEGRTNNPYRTDRMTFIQSSRWKAYYRDAFPRAERLHYLHEYARDEDGVPHWRRLYPGLNAE